MTDHGRSRKTTTHRLSEATLGMIQHLLQTNPSRYRTRTQVVEIAVEELFRSHLEGGREPPLPGNVNGS